MEFMKLLNSLSQRGLISYALSMQQLSYMNYVCSSGMLPAFLVPGCSASALPGYTEYYTPVLPQPSYLPLYQMACLEVQLWLCPHWLLRLKAQLEGAAGAMS